MRESCAGIPVQELRMRCPIFIGVVVKPMKKEKIASSI